MISNIKFLDVWNLLVNIYRKVIFLYNGLINFLTKEFIIPGLGTFDVLDIIFGAGLIAVITWLFVKFVLPT